MASSPGARQHQQQMSIESERDAIEAFIDAFRAALSDPNMPTDLRKEATVRINTVAGELGLPKPNEGIVRQGLHSLRAIAENLAASGLFVELVNLAHRIHF
jgi:hypothetical protein